MGNARRYNKLSDLVLDGLTDALRVIDIGDSMTHNEKGFMVSKKFTHGVGASPNILITTPDTVKHGHFKLKVISNAAVDVDLYEGTNYAGGTGLTEVNKNRNSATVATIAAANDATGASKGTSIWADKAAANRAVEMDRIVLKQNTLYLVETVGANGDLITVILDWYEHQR